MSGPGRIDLLFQKSAGGFTGVNNPIQSQDASADVQRFSFRRGRNSLLDRVEAGRLTVELIDRDGVYDTDATPQTGARIDWRCRLFVTRPGGTPVVDARSVFVGYVAGNNQSPSVLSAGSPALVRVDVNDGFHILALARISQSFGSELSSVRVAALDDYMILQNGNIDTGKTTIQAVTLSQAPVLEHLQLVSQSESGMLFANRSGTMTFRNRHNLHSPTASLVCTFADTGAVGTIRYAEIVKSFTDDELYTRVEITREGGVVQVAEDINAQGKYGLRVLNRSGLLMTTTAESADMANWLLSRYKQPRQRIKSLVVYPDDNPTHWDTLLQLDLGDRVDVIRTLTAGASPATKTHACIIQGIDHDYDAGDQFYRMTFRLDDVTGETAWILGDSVFGVMDSTTILGY